MMKEGKPERGVVEIEIMGTERLILPRHLLRKIDTAVLFQHLDGLASLRGTLRRAETDVAYRWLLGYTMNDGNTSMTSIMTA